ncbi:MAG: bifunctional glutamate N-acetyltransferase/amino-acid acetyltransferase ArgJ [Candidatus Loosdrechtia sp.]|uniref:bifunctional ornithine acetyltransferase/N-acetylglutamate synthase n=1 Tax=Candidatus Loosdrechtia sp. TaxID=3101272 RepID=UPI003A76B083|nr:MAG: bifunctional glutamate N-acetyltransferase/amino-acid acetyltransferase ArgJ [Candidatus Jettenia sp. AMX2]
MEVINKGCIIAPKGFLSGTTYCGIKTIKDSPDLGIIFSEYPSTGTALFTINQICAAPVKLSRKIIQKGQVRSIVVNSGNANACTGDKGYRDAREMVRLTAECLKISEDEVLVASTGIIGRPLPMDKVAAGIKTASASMGNTPEHGNAMAQAIMTTDTKQKEIAVTLTIEGKEVILGGITKGAGMIAPNLATMLCFITTDASVPASLLHECLKKSVESSFNRITIDGHMSTNDTIAIIANGASGVKVSSDKGNSDRSSLQIFQQGLNSVTSHLAKSIVMDGEGATKFIRIDVAGARSRSDAAQIARSIANSPLVKTAIHGEDPNWGRIISAAGYAGIELDESKISLFINGAKIFAGGMPVPDDPGIISASMKNKDIGILLELGLGDYTDTIWTCDLSHEYITINAEYHT